MVFYIPYGEDHHFCSPKFLCLRGFFSGDTGHRNKIKSISSFYSFLRSLVYLLRCQQNNFLFGLSGSVIAEEEKEGVGKAVVSVPSRTTQHMDKITGGVRCHSGTRDKGLPENIICA